MKIILVLITAILGIIGWLKRDTVPFYCTLIVIGLFALFAAVSIFVEIRDVKEKRKASYAGTLQPKDNILLSVEKNIYPKLELGDGGTIFSFAGRKGEPLFKFFEDSHITILIEEEQLKVSVKISNKNGVIAELIKNEWKVNPNNVFDRNYSRDALEVKDNTGDIVLQVKHAGDRIQLQGKFYDINGNGIGFGKSITGEGGIIETTGSNHPWLELRIEPMFMYPSELHLGKLNKVK